MSNHAIKKGASAFLRLFCAFALAVLLVPAGAITGFAPPLPAYADEKEQQIDIQSFVENTAAPDKVGEAEDEIEAQSMQDDQGINLLPIDMKPSGYALGVKHTFVDEAFVDDGLLLSNLFTDYVDGFMYMAETAVNLYDPGEQSDNYVAFIDTAYMSGFTTGEIRDVAAALRNEAGTEVTEVEFDLGNGLVYVPKSLFDYWNVMNWGLQVQLVEVIPSNAQTSNIEVHIDNKRSDVTAVADNNVYEINAYDTFTVPLVTDGVDAINNDDICVRINDGAPLSEDMLDYDVATGLLSVALPGTSVLSLDVEINRDGIFEAEKAYAYDHADWLRYLCDINGNETVYTSLDPADLSFGEYFEYTGIISYAESNANEQAYYFTKNFLMCYHDEPGGVFRKNEIAQWMYNGGAPQYKGQTDQGWYEDSGFFGDITGEIQDITLSGQMPHGVMTSNTGKSIDFSSENMNGRWLGGGYYEGVLPLMCAHVVLPSLGVQGASQQNKIDGTGNIRARVLATGDDYVLFGLMTAQSHSQSGFGAYKVRCRPYMQVDIHKGSTQPNMTTNNSCYTLAGAAYAIYTDAACTQRAVNRDGVVVPTLVTDANGYATTGEKCLKRGPEYYVKELKAPVGFKVDETVYRLSDFIKTGAIVNMNLYDVPKDDPIGLVVYKGSDEFSNTSDSGGLDMKDVVAKATRLGGAEFTLSYYDGYYASLEDLERAIEEDGVEPKTVGVWTSDENGEVNMYGAPTRMVKGAVNGDWPHKHTVTSKDLLYGDFAGYQVGSVVNTWPLGTVTIEETKAPVGYEKDDGIFGCQVVDAATIPGFAQFADVWGAVFVDWRDAWPTYSNDEGHDEIYVPNKPSGSDLGANSGQGTHVIVDEPYRGDLNFTKKAEDTQKPLEGVPFVLIDKYTGEHHIVVTDSNGQWNSANEYNRHSVNTNANDDAVTGLELTRDADGMWTVNTENAVVDASKLTEEAGCWFYGKQDYDDFVGLDTVDIDSRGALPYSEYRMIELKVDKAADGTSPGVNSGYVMISVNSIKLSRQNYEFDLGTLDNQLPTGPAIQTEARDSVDGDHYVSADAASDVIDRVEYLSLVQDRDYVMKTWLVYKDFDGDGEPDDAESAVPVYTEDDGSPRYWYTEFNAKDRPNGAVDVVLEGIDTRELAGKQVVFFEECYESDGNGGGQQMVADHKNTGDYNQMLEIIGPEIGTTLVDGKTGGKEVPCDDEATLVDTIEYRNLVPGHEYTATGTLMVKDGNGGVTELLDADGNPVTASTTFTPKDENGHVDVTFVLDASQLADKELVAYEVVTRVTAEGGEPEEIGKHEDPEDEGQTVTVVPMRFDTDIKSNGAWEDEKAVVADSEASVTDVVHYERAVVGDAYTAYGILFDPESGLPIMQYAPQADDKDAYKAVSQTRLKRFTAELFDAAGIATTEGAYDVFGEEFDGYPVLMDMEALEALFANKQYTDIVSRLVMATTHWTPDAPAGDTALEYRFDARFMPYAKAVSMVVIGHDKDATLVAGGMDIHDERETVAFVTPAIGTTATDGTDGDKYVQNGQDAVVVDKVDYTGLVAGKEYVLRGTLMDKATGEPLYVDDEKIVAEQYFVPAASEGSVNVTFTFDATDLPDCYLVVFEELYRDMNTGDDSAEDVKVAVHEDIDDEAQTVAVTGDAPKLPNTGSTYGKTGIEAAFPWIAAGIALLALAGLGYAVALRRRSREQAVFGQEPPKE